MYNNFQNDAESPVVISGLFARTNASGNATYSAVLKQKIERVLRNGSAASNGNPLLAVALGTSIPSTTIISYPQTFKAEQWPTLRENLVAAGFDVPEQLPEATAQTTFFATFDADNMPTAMDMFGVDVDLELTESVFQDPFNQNQQPVMNPSTGEIVTPLNADGDNIEVDGVVTDRYYRHVQVVAAGTAQHQFIHQSEDGRELPSQVTERYNRTIVTNVGEQVVQ